MANPIQAVAAYLLTNRFKVRQDRQILCTAVAAFASGPLAMAPAFVAVGATRPGFGSGGLFRRSPPQFHQRETFTLVAPPSPPPPDTTPPQVKVKDYTGQARDVAVSGLQGLNLKVGEREEVFSGQKGGVVMKQTHVGEWVSQGTQVNLTISKDPSPPAAPTPTDEMTAIEKVKGDVNEFKNETNDRLNALQSDIAIIKAAVVKPAASAGGSGGAAGSGAQAGSKPT